MSNDNDNQMKKLVDLKVVELRYELEKRNLDKNGNKASLIERLTKDLVDNGHDPNEYLFDVQRKNVGKRLGTPVGKSKEKEEENESEDDGHLTMMSDNEENDELRNSRNYQSGDNNNDCGEKSGREFADIVEDALKLDVDHELNEYREDQILDLTDHRRNTYKVSDDHNEEKDKDKSGSGKQWEQGKNLDTSTSSSIGKRRSLDLSEDISKKSGTDDSMIVNVNDTRSENGGDIDTSVSNSINTSNISNKNSNNDSLNISKTDVDDVDYEEDIEENEEEGDDEEEDIDHLKKEKTDDDSKNKIDEELNKNDGKDGEIVNNSSITSPVVTTASGKDSKESRESDKQSSKNKSSSSKSLKTSADKKTSASSKNVWVSGLSPNTRASDLQALFKKYGKVISAKIITNPRIPGSRCFGLITMETCEQVEKCIQNLNKTELHGVIINVEKNNETSSSQSKSKSSSSSTRKDKSKKEETKSSKTEIKAEKTETTDDKESSEKKDEKTSKNDSDDKKDDKKSKTKDGKSHERSKSKERKHNRSPSPFNPRNIIRKPFGIRKPALRRPGSSFMMMRRNFRGVGLRSNPVLLRKIENERVMRRREREREFRDSERKAELMRQQRELERKHQEERDRIEREKEKLRIERERLEREKAELFRIEREKTRLERERIERERDEIRRRQVSIPSRIDDNSRGRNMTLSSSSMKRAYESREFDPYWDERKRLASRLGDAPMPPRGFETNLPSRFSDFDARPAHSSYDNRGGDYKRIKAEISSSGPSRNDYEIRRESTRHMGHDRDDRRSSGSQSYYRDSSRMVQPSRERDRRGGNGGPPSRDEWKQIHHERRDRYMDKPIPQSMPSYSSAPRSFIGEREWSSGDRAAPTSTITKIPYNNPSSVDSRNRGQSLNATMMGNGVGPGNGLQIGNSAIYTGNSSMPMSGLISSVSAPVSNNDRSYIHSVRRF